MKLKTICLIHHATMQGGGSKSLIDLANMLKEQYRVIVCIPKSDSNMKYDIMNQNLEIYEFKEKIPTLMSFSGGPPLISKNLIKTILAMKNVSVFCSEIEKLKPDAIFYNSIVSIICAPFFKNTINQFVIVRETLKNKITIGVYSYLLKKYFSGCCFIAGIEIKKLHLNNLPTLVVADSVQNVEMIDFDNTEKQENCKLLFLGGGQRIKGAEVLLKSLPFVNEQFSLTIAGEFPNVNYKISWYLKHFASFGYWIYLKRLNNLLFQSEKKFDIKCIGYCNDVSSLIQNSDILIFPSTSVHQPRPCIEAGYFSKAVILSDYDETKEYFIDGYNAVTFKPGDYHMLAKKIDKLIINEEYRNMLGKNNQIMSHKYHSYEQIKRELLYFMTNKF